MSVGIANPRGIRLCVGQLPGRKLPSLYFWDPLGIRTLASFRSEAAAQEAEDFLLSMIGHRVVDERAEDDG